MYKGSTYNYTIIIVSFLFVFANNAESQIFLNNGADIIINTGAEVLVNGNTQNDTGQLINDGDCYLEGDITNNAQISGNGNYYLSGDWLNNQNFSQGNSLVDLQGANQLIGGNASSTFYNLTLSGTGIKSLDINTSVENNLDLTDREFATENYQLTVLNTSLNAIQRTTGFVSSLTNGYLIRNTNTTSAYLYPVGSSLGTQRYRPVEISPQSTNNNSYAVRMVNNDASSNGYDRNLVDTNFCNLNPEFYHLINQTSGTAAADISFFYDEVADSYWDGIANWQTNIWNSVGQTNLTTGTPFNEVSFDNWSNFSNEPYILGINPISVNLPSPAYYCTGSFVTLDAGSGYDSYLWSTGDTSQTINVSTDTLYYVTVSLSGCSATDSVKVTEHLLNVEIGTETTICPGDTAPLYVNGGTSYLWSTGDTLSNINVSPQNTTTYIVTVSDNVCSVTDSVTIHVSSLPVADAGNNQTICINDSINLNASGGTDYLWNTGDSVASFYVQPNTTTEYIVTVTNSYGCSDIDSVTISVINSVSLTISGNNDICYGESTVLTVTGAGNYLWNTGSTDSIITVSPLTDTIYSVSGNIGSCGDTASINVYVHPVPNADVSNDTSICQGNTVTITATGGGSYLWSNGSTSASQQVTPSSTTQYIVTVSNSYNCTDADTVTIYVNNSVNANAGTYNDICSGDTLQLSATGGQNYEWSPSYSLSDNTIQNPLCFPSATTTYYLTVSDSMCTDIDSVTISVHSNPQVDAGVDTSITEGESIELQAYSPNNIVAYNWSPATSLSQINIYNPIATPGTTTNYSVLVTDENGCTAKDFVIITVNEAENTDLIIYNTFTPNNDGKNDKWYIENIEDYPDNYIQIFNRNGHLVYEKKGYLNEWDGKYYGNDLPAATYYYIIDLNNNTDILKGYVTIIR